ncbi:hypothetical protein L345_09699, partial [Ophiophagus hannah]
MQLDHILNKDIQVFKVSPAPDKMREVRLQWYRHVVRADVESIVKWALALSPDGWECNEHDTLTQLCTFLGCSLSYPTNTTKDNAAVTGICGFSLLSISKPGPVDKPQVLKTQLTLFCVAYLINKTWKKIVSGIPFQRQECNKISSNAENSAISY